MEILEAKQSTEIDLPEPDVSLSMIRTDNSVALNQSVLIPSADKTAVTEETSKLVTESKVHTRPTRPASAAKDRAKPLYLTRTQQAVRAKRIQKLMDIGVSKAEAPAIASEQLRNVFLLDKKINACRAKRAVKFEYLNFSHGVEYFLDKYIRLRFKPPPQEPVEIPKKKPKRQVTVLKQETQPELDEGISEESSTSLCSTERRER